MARVVHSEPTHTDKYVHDVYRASLGTGNGSRRPVGSRSPSDQHQASSGPNISQRLVRKKSSHNSLASLAEFLIYTLCLSSIRWALEVKTGVGPTLRQRNGNFGIKQR